MLIKSSWLDVLHMLNDLGEDEHSISLEVRLRITLTCDCPTCICAELVYLTEWRLHAMMTRSINTALKKTGSIRDMEECWLLTSQPLFLAVPYTTWGFTQCTWWLRPLPLLCEAVRTSPCTPWWRVKSSVFTDFTPETVSVTLAPVTVMPRPQSFKMIRPVLWPAWQHADEGFWFPEDNKRSSREKDLSLVVVDNMQVECGMKSQNGRFLAAVTANKSQHAQLSIRRLWTSCRDAQWSLQRRAKSVHTLTGCSFKASSLLSTLVFVCKESDSEWCKCSAVSFSHFEGLSFKASEIII